MREVEENRAADAFDGEPYTLRWQTSEWGVEGNPGNWIEELCLLGRGQPAADDGGGHFGVVFNQ
jgi:hypothetical protein